MDLEDEMSKDKQALLDEFERRKKARLVNVSTDDSEVLNSPIMSMFNELLVKLISLFYISTIILQTRL